MGKLGPVQEQSMEEILASIRRMISDGDARSGAPTTAEPRIVETSRPAGNVAKLFADHEEAPEPAEEVPDNVVELAIAQAMEEARAEVRADAMVVRAPPIEPEPAPPASTPAAVPMASLAGPSLPPAAEASPDLATSGAREAAAVEDPHLPSPDERFGGQPLLSPRSDAMVSSAFNQLATTMLSGSARTIDELVEDLLRPMLRSWLDVNLPPLVERLVREEIERVSRGRR
jgi:cell pole-organizing protein PopZ